MRGRKNLEVMPPVDATTLRSEVENGLTFRDAWQIDSVETLAQIIDRGFVKESSEPWTQVTGLRQQTVAAVLGSVLPAEQLRARGCGGLTIIHQLRLANTIPSSSLPKLQK